MPSLFAGEAMLKRARPHFSLGKLCSNEHASLFRWGSNAQTSTPSLFAGEAMPKQARLPFCRGESKLIYPGM
ncbi:MAG: hypothetical protein IH595_05250 [Bacteroidales bacterium]|nr:hypothetical protein [Bacteroidales bacterium]